MEPTTPAKPIPQVNDQRPDASAQSRLLGWLILGAFVLFGLPCLILTATEVTGLSHLVDFLAPEDGTLVIEVDDPGATVVVMGRYTSRGMLVAPEIPLAPGEYNIRVESRATGQYRVHNATITIEPGQATVVTPPWATAQSEESTDAPDQNDGVTPADADGQAPGNMNPD